MKTVNRPILPRQGKFVLAVLAFAGLLAFTATKALAAPSASAPEKSLQIYFIDVEGGQSTLFVTPEGESLLIDTGWPLNEGRDASRIVAAAHDAGISRIDFVLITHFHADHVGGVPQLAAKIPIGTFIDHGESRETSNKVTEQIWLAYKALLDSGKFRHIVAKPGMVLPIKGLHGEILSADGSVIDTPLLGAGQPNPACASPAPPDDASENPRSVGTLFTFGKLRILDLGDLTADKERLLVCPINRIGTVDVYIASHHGLAQSNSAPLLNAIQPRVAIVDNGENKGGSPAALDIIRNSPNKPDMWQLHFAAQSGVEHNTSAPFIANLTGPDAGNYLKLTAQPDGSFAVYNSRTRQTVNYKPAR